VLFNLFSDRLKLDYNTSVTKLPNTHLSETHHPNGQHSGSPANSSIIQLIVGASHI